MADSIDPLLVFERDKWACHLCGRKTPARLRGSCDPRAPEIDHVLPLAAGGTHTWGNVKCACRECNGRKSDRPLGQLGLELAA
ncbi:HNH endonuclease [Luteimonas saliphila]|uniref:HNH endonuclease n=1 Tax=Luteimonas saliphila TaxID=2804919 RepID=UPI001EE2EB17|nr:HNH endonuclease [Luteimonas saliphila]